MSNAILAKFQEECTAYLHSQLNNRLFKSSITDKTAASEYYLTEYQRCIAEQEHFLHYLHEQLISLDALKSCEIAIDKFLERLKAVHEYELKQNETFEQILHELTKINPSSQEERLQLLGQIDELIAYKAKLTGHASDQHSSTNKLVAKSSDTFKNLL